MIDTLAEQILSTHLVEGKLEEGAEIGLKIDQTLTQDATGTMVYLEFESLGIPTVTPEVAVSYVDHNIIQTDSRNADDHRFLQSCAAKFGIVFSPPGNGVSHHVHRQRFGVPGQTLLGSDSHTTTGGCLGMLAMGAGGVEIAMAMAGHPYYVETPKVWGFYVEGRFDPFVSGKDLILHLLGQYSCKAGTGKIMEFFGPGVKNMDMAARSTIANMSVDARLARAEDRTESSVERGNSNRSRSDRADGCVPIESGQRDTGMRIARYRRSPGYHRLVLQWQLP